MTNPAARRSPVALAEGWTVEIPMPVDRKGHPVGWVSLNGREHWREKHRRTQAWRIAARDAYAAHRLRRGLDHVYIEIVFRFPDRRHRDPSNFEATAKPIIDALQPQKTSIIRDKETGKPKLKKGGRFETREDIGWGVVPGDDPRYITRGPEMPVGEPLGRDHPVKGMVIITIKPFPREDAPC
jgi:hypothetical protein